MFLPRVVLAVVILSAPAEAAEPALAAEEIMARVAENQDRAVEQRREFMYRQTARVRLLQTNRKLRWDETREYDVAPTPDGSESKLVRTFGERRKGRNFVLFDVAGETIDANGLDADLVDSFHEQVAGRNGGRDGFAPDLFPLTTGQQRQYSFRLEAEEEYRGRNVYRLRFEPRPQFGAAWRGEALVDRAEFQPVFVATQFAVEIPLWVRALFGINVRQVGFSVNYKRFDENVWFPVSYGGEFLIKVFHFYKRTAIVSLVNDDFRRATAESNIAFDDSEMPGRVEP